MARPKLIELEAARGIAALVVLLSHLLTAFFPRFHGLRFPDETFSLFGTPLFALVNGSAAVVVFFVLSGFVLTKGAFEDRSYLKLAVSAVKRWPRLFPSILIVNVAAGLLAGLHLFFNRQAGSEIQSAWLGAFYGLERGFWQHLAISAQDGLLYTFIASHDYYNSSLWTMYYEFMGSFLALALAGAMLWLRKVSWLIGIFAIMYAFVMMDPFFFCFPVGAVLGYAYTRPSWRTLAGWIDRPGPAPVTVLLAIAVFAFAYHESRNGLPPGYPFLRAFYDLSPDHTRIMLHTLGAVAAILLVTCRSNVRTHLRGRGGAFLGQISFPLYLVHVPIICSIGAATFVYSSPSLPRTAALLLSCLTSALAAFLCAIPLMRFEGWWLRILRSKTTLRPALQEGGAVPERS